MIGSGAGMVAAVDFTEAGGVDVGVDLGSGDVGVSEHLLDGADVGAMGEHMRGEAVSEDVRGDAACGNADSGGTFTNDLEDALAGKGTSETRDEDMIFGEITFGETAAGAREIGV